MAEKESGLMNTPYEKEFDYQEYMRENAPDPSTINRGTKAREKRFKTAKTNKSTLSLNMTGQLFTHYFLTDGIKATAEWQASLAQPEAFIAFKDGVARHHDALSRSSQNPNEARTEEELVRPVLELLGWTEYVPQPNAAGHEDIPDHLLFADAESKARDGNPFQYATVVEESKRFGLALDSRDRNDRAQRGTPHGQILRYLATAEIESEGRIRWGILTNGSIWRLYDYRARPRASGFFEVDLAELLKPGKEDDLRVFHLLFRRESFTLRDGATSTFLEAALAEGRRYEEQVAGERVFPNLVNALVQKSEEIVASRDAALIFLYRLLFVLAEDRGLFVNGRDYGAPFDDIASRMAADDTYRRLPPIIRSPRRVQAHRQGRELV